jgi:hypothetical protein
MVNFEESPSGVVTTTTTTTPERLKFQSQQWKNETNREGKQNTMREQRIQSTIALGTGGIWGQWPIPIN